MRSPVRAALLGVIVAALITLPGLGVGTLWDNSETAYGEVAREILLTHDWIVMHLNGSPWFVSGAPDPRWSNDDLHSLQRVTGKDFEVVDTSSLRP